MRMHATGMHATVQRMHAAGMHAIVLRMHATKMHAAVTTLALIIISPHHLFHNATAVVEQLVR
jgi:hypothetical protein